MKGSNCKKKVESENVAAQLLEKMKGKMGQKQAGDDPEAGPRDQLRHDRKYVDVVNHLIKTALDSAKAELKEKGIVPSK